MDIFEVMRTQRSVKRFKPDPVSDDDIRTILTAATWAPNGHNAQPWEFIVVKDPEVKKRLADIYREGLQFPAGPSPPRRVARRSTSARSRR